MDTAEAARRWAREWERGWREHDLDRVAALYALGVSYRSSPFREPRRPTRYAEGRSRTRMRPTSASPSRWRSPATARPSSGGRSAARATQRRRWPAISLLRFDEKGLVCEEREYWHEETGPA